VLLALLGLGPIVPVGAAEVPYEGHTGAVRCLAFAPDGRHALSGGEDKVVRYFDTRTWRQIYKWHTHQGPIHAVAFSPDGKQCLSAGGDGTIKVYRLDHGQVTATFDLQGTAIHAALFLEDGAQVLAGAADGSIHRWDLATHNKLSVWHGDNAPVVELAASRDSGTVCSLDAAGVGRTWEVSTGRELRRLPEPEKEYILKGKLQPQGQYQARVSPAGPDKNPAALLGNQSGRVLGGFSPEGRRVVRARRCLVEIEGRYWNPGRPASQFQPARTGTLFDALLAPFNILGSIFGNDDGEAPGWKQINKKVISAQFTIDDPKTGALVKRFLGDPGSPITVLSLSEEGTRLVFGCADGSAWVIRLNSQQPVSVHPSHPRPVHPVPGAANKERDEFPSAAVTAVDLGRPGDRLLVGHADGSVRLWNLLTRTLMQPKP
jgi:WD40 repeat protein